MIKLEGQNRWSLNGESVTYIFNWEGKRTTQTIFFLDKAKHIHEKIRMIKHKLVKVKNMITVTLLVQ